MHFSFTRWAWWCFTKYYNLRLGSGYNLGNGLNKSGEKSQSVKCKDTGLYLQLYIPIDNKVNILLTYVK